MIRQTAKILAFATILGLTACGGGSSLPEPTGRASVRAVNAIPGSPDIVFFIEERALGNVSYQSISPTNRFDDFTYIFNFELRFAGDTEDTRIASRSIDFVPDADYTLVLTGTVAAPVVSVWETVERNFDPATTLFQSRFAHTTTEWGSIDVYFAPDGTAPVPGEQVASLDPGDISAAADFEQGDYVLTITTPKNPGDLIDPVDILFQSDPATITAGAEMIVSPFDGNADNAAPVIVRGLLATGISFSIPDPAFPPEIEFVHAAFDLGPVDVYDDEMLTSAVIDNHSFTEQTPFIDVAPGDSTFRFTPAGSTASITYEGTTSFSPGARYRIVSSGGDGTYQMRSVINQQSSVDTGVKILTYHESVNFNQLSYFAVPPGETIDEAVPFRVGQPAGVAVDGVIITPGEYDIYVVEAGSTEILAGPVAIDVATGDVVDFFVFDTADPAVLDLRILNLP